MDLTSTATSTSGRAMQRKRTRTDNTEMQAYTSIAEMTETTRMTEMPSTQFFAMAELVEILAKSLDASSLINVAMTNRFLFEILEHLLWPQLDLCDPNEIQRRLHSPKGREALYRSIGTVRHLKLHVSALHYLVDSMAQYSDENHNHPTTIESNFDPTSPKGKTKTLATLPWRGPDWLPELPLVNPLTVALPPITDLCSLDFEMFDSQGQNIFPAATAYTHQEDFSETYYRSLEIRGELELTWLLSHNTALTRVQLNNYAFSSIDVSLHFVRAIARLTSLQDLGLNLRLCEMSLHSILRILYCNLPASLETLRLRCRYYTGHKSDMVIWQSDEGLFAPGNETGPIVHRRGGPLKYLKSIRIVFDHKTNEWLLGEFVRSCPALEAISPPLWPGENCRLLTETVVDRCPRLRELDNCGHGSADILKALPDDSLDVLSNHSFAAGDEVNPILEMVAMQHCRSIRKIRLVQCQHIDGKTVRSILMNCRSLEHFSVQDKDRSSIRLKDLVEGEWNAVRLKVLDITVELRQQRYTAAYLRKQGQAIPAVTEGTWERLKKFYRRLGTLKDIEVLNLRIKSKELQWLDESGQARPAPPSNSSGKEIDDDWNSDSEPRTENHNSADATFPGFLSLGDKRAGRRGYLKLLVGLTNLRELRGHVQATTSETRWTVGRREMVWMVKNWPSLEVIELFPADGEMGKCRQHLDWFEREHKNICVKQATPLV
ncbi:hypothetical protein F5H01DRAFT_40279 [Linnemannia elongata]|nr:hypothetical protein F5H01DRAFT_40279 [Linnemannia elongata]